MCDQCPRSQHQRLELHERLAEFSHGPLAAGEFNSRFAASVVAKSARTELAVAATQNHGGGGDAGVIPSAARMLLQKKATLPATAAASDPKRFTQDYLRKLETAAATASS